MEKDVPCLTRHIEIVVRCRPQIAVQRRAVWCHSQSVIIDIGEDLILAHYQGAFAQWLAKWLCEKYLPITGRFHMMEQSSLAASCLYIPPVCIVVAVHE